MKNKIYKHKNRCTFEAYIACKIFMVVSIIIIILMSIKCFANDLNSKYDYIGEIKNIPRDKVLIILDEIFPYIEFEITGGIIIKQFNRNSHPDKFETKLFINYIKPYVLLYKLYDKKFIYIWHENNYKNSYPEPIEYDEIIKTNDSLIIYLNKNLINIFESKDIKSVKYKYYYKNLLIYEGYNDYENTYNDGIINNNMQSSNMQRRIQY